MGYRLPMEASDTYYDNTRMITFITYLQASGVNFWNLLGFPNVKGFPSDM